MREKGKIHHLLEEIEALTGRITELESIQAAQEQRIRAANCLYEVARLLEEKDLSLNDIFDKTVNVLASSLELQANRQVRVVLGNKMIDSENPPRSSVRLSCDLMNHGIKMGVLEIYQDGGLGDGESHLVTAVGGLLTRIIEQKRTEQALLENERNLRTLVEDSPTGIFIVQNGQIVYENPEEKRLSGPLAQLFRNGDLSSIHPEDMVKVKEGFQKIMSGERRTLDIDFRYFVHGSLHTEAEMKWVHCRASLIDYMGSRAILVNKLDVTRTKELEFLIRAEDKMASLGRIASGIAHEIRNPLSGINIYLSNLEKIIDKRENTRKAKEILGEIQSASNRIESVIRRVMDFSKPSEPIFMRVDINQSIQNAINFSLVTLQKSAIVLNTLLAKDLPPCNADPHLIEQVILNLITNAKEAMKNMVNKKTINVVSSAQSDRIVVTISDSGPGVPLHMRKKIFDPFYTTKEGNTGIGLSLCFRIVVDHGGSLTVGDNELGGAEFKIELPLKTEKRTLQEW